MILEEIIKKEYETKDDLTVDLAKAMEEHNELQSSFDTVKAERDELAEENNALKTKNLELLSMIPVIKEEVKEEVKEEIEEEISLEEILADDLKEGE